MDIHSYIFSRILEDSRLNPQIAGFYINTFEPGYSMEVHCHPTVEVISVLHGASYMVIKGQYVKIRKNECLVLFPDVAHSFFLSSRESCRLMNVHFNPGDISFFFKMENLQESLRFFYELKTNTQSYIRLVDNTTIRDITGRIMEEAGENSEFSGILQKLYFCELYIRLSQIMGDQYNRMTRPLSAHTRKAMQHIQNFYNDVLTADSIARQAGISSRQLSRLFTRELGMTAMDYANELRIRKARELLEHSNLDITHIAQTLGFSTSQYFTTCFKKSESITPGQYRRLVHDRKLNKY